LSNTDIQNPDQPVEAIEAPAPVVEAPVPVELLRYEYQPTDEQGRPLGAKQVIKYTNPDELASKLTEQNTLLIRKLRQETRKNRLGIMDAETISDEAPRFEEPVSFAPRVLSPDERLAISRDLLDPEKFDEASDKLFEAKMGAKPELLGRTIAELQEDRIRARAKTECDAFVGDNPDYVKCQENFEAITGWMVRYGLAPVKTNFQKAYDKLRYEGVLIENYAEPQPDEPQPIPAPAPAPVAPAPAPVAPAPAPVKRIPTGLSRNDADDTGTSRPVGDEIMYEVVVGGKKRVFTGLAAINAMPADEYKRRVMSDPSFAKAEAQLYKEMSERRNVR
jgi:hypothetical protein